MPIKALKSAKELQPGDVVADDKMFFDLIVSTNQSAEQCGMIELRVRRSFYEETDKSYVMEGAYLVDPDTDLITFTDSGVIDLRHIESNQS